MRLENSGAAFSDLVGTARLIGALQPDPAKGSSVKRRLTNRMGVKELAISIDDILLLRNFDSTPFADGDKLWQCIQSWTTRQLVGEVPGDAISPLFSDACKEDKATPAWRCGIWNGLKDVPADQRVRLSSNVWRIVSSKPALLAPLLDRCPIPDRLTVLWRTASRRSTSLPTTLFSAEFCSTVISWRPEAELLCQADPGALRDAIEQLTKRGSSNKNARAIDRALTHLPETDLIALPSTIDHPHVFKRAVEKLVGKPKLVAGIDHMDSKGQNLWASALKQNPELWKAGDDPESVLNSLVSSLVDGNAVETALLEELAKSPMASLLNHPRRAEAWAVLQSTARDDFLEATADDWITAVFAGNTVAAAESELVATIVTYPQKD